MSDSLLHPAAIAHDHAPAWRDALRAAGIRPGDRVVLALPPSAAFVAALAGARAAGATVAVARPGEDADALLDVLDTRLVIANGTGAGVLGADGPRPADIRTTLRARRGEPTPGAAWLLRTSGTSGAPRWCALSAANVDAVLASHADALPGAHDRVLSALPWHHAFGLVLELLAACRTGAALVRDPLGGRDAATMVALARTHGATWFSAVPLLVERAARAREGDALLDALRGGIVGGAPVERALAARLASTRLRVGYGQTEAAPGIALGEPGEWAARLLGRPRGCEVRVGDDGALAFRGANAAIGEWVDGALVRHAPARWVETGDVVRHDEHDRLVFVGRASAAFKLASGRWVEAHRVEAALHERVPSLDTLMLGTEDGRSLVLAWTDASRTAPDAEAVHAALGPLAALPLELREVAPDAWKRTPKGDVDRRAGLPHR